jgi:molybdate transport system permease protein
MSNAEISAILLSVRVAVVAVLLILPPGIWLAWILARKRFPGKFLLDTVVNLPLVLPPVVTGYALLVLFGRNGFLGGWLESNLGWRVVFDWKGAALASAVVAFPLFVRSVRIAFEETDRSLEQAARTLGDSGWMAFWRITLPLARNGVIAGCLLAFARALGEFGATIMLAGNIPGQTRTIPLYIYQQLQTPGGDQSAWTLVCVSVLVAGAALIIGNWLQRPG